MIVASTKRFGFVLMVLLFATATYAAEPDDSNHQWLRVSTDWEPDAALASAAAEAKLRVALTQWLAATRPSCARAATTENLTRLLSLPEVRRTETAEQKDRPYGTVVRAHVAIHIPPATLDAWQAELQADARLRRSILWTRCGLTLAGLVVSVVVTRGLDAWTRGYRRKPLGIFLATVLLALLAVIWGM